MATTTPVVITSQAAFTDAFDGEQLGTSQGRWRYDTGGTSATGRTGPGTNNTLSFMHTEVSNIPDTETLEDAEERGVAAFAAVPDQAGRTLHMRLCIQGDFHNGVEGLEIQQRATDADAWEDVFHVHGWDYSNNWDAGDIITDDTGFTTTPVPTVTASTGAGSGAVLSSITVGADGRINSLTWASGGSDYALGDVLLITQAGPNGDSVGSFSIADGNWIVGGVLQDITSIFIAGGVERTAAADGGWIDFEIPIPDTATQVRLHPRYFDGGGATYRHDVALRSFFWEWPDTDHAVDGGDIGVGVAVSQAQGTKTTQGAGDGGDINVAVAVSQAQGTKRTGQGAGGGDINVAVAVSQATGTLIQAQGNPYMYAPRTWMLGDAGQVGRLQQLANDYQYLRFVLAAFIPDLGSPPDSVAALAGDFSYADGWKVALSDTVTWTFKPLDSADGDLVLIRKADVAFADLDETTADSIVNLNSRV